MYGNKNGSKVFGITVAWVVTETIDVKANLLRAAIDFIFDKVDDIPLVQNFSILMEHGK